MNKRLEEMSLEELWPLFPIFLVEHNEMWKVDNIQKVLENLVGLYAIMD